VKFSECPSKAAGVWYNKRKAGKNDPGRKREPMLKMNRPDAEQSALSLEKRFETTLTAALNAIHSATSPDSTTPEDLERQRKGQELLGRMVTPMLGMRWEPFEIGGMPAAWVRPEQGEHPRKIVLYCHGGGYTTGNLGYGRPLAAKLAQ